LQTSPETTEQQQEQLVQALLDPACYGHPLESVTVRETHISWVLLAGEFAYKLKKAVNFGFLDFSTLEQRRYYCGEELRLNRRFAPGLYLDVIEITGSPEQPEIGGSGAVLEYAVRMRRFPQAGLLSQVAENHQLDAAHVDEIVTLVAGMHAQADQKPADPEAGSPADIRHWVDENFTHIRHVRLPPEQRLQVDELDNRCKDMFAACGKLMQSRREDGFVRECHGDLHLGNLALVDQQITPFDCIEFNPRLRWIDVMSEVAFLVMDLQERGYPVLAYRFLNDYLQHSGDYAGLRLLNYYLVYRALVRAKVAVLRSAQSDLDAAGQLAARAEFAAHLELAVQYARPRPRAIIITHGVSGSGKSWWSERLSGPLGAIRIRSDIERKRLFGYRPDATTDSGISSGIYTAAAGVRTYERLAELARQAIDAGFPVIVDAAFLQRAARDRFKDLAGEQGVPCIVLHCEASAGVLRARLEKRQAHGSDPSEAGVEVLESQLDTQEPLQPDEFGHCNVVTASGDPSGKELAARVGDLIAAS
jgi:aminoglycoside phosphotransferase family enzyme/gluconate kinase